MSPFEMFEGRHPREHRASGLLLHPYL
jgi:hypothetical protein